MGNWYLEYKYLGLHSLLLFFDSLLFPGGSANLSTSQYAKIGSLLYKMAIESNDKGDFFPIFGICLGYELLTVLQSGKLEILTSCNSSDQALKLNFLPGILKEHTILHLILII